MILPAMENVLGHWLVAWLAAEALFFWVIIAYLAPRMNRIEPPAEYPIEGEKLMHKILETVDWLIAQDDADTTFESFLSGWFIGAKSSELKRGNMVVFLAWTMFAKEWSTTSQEERKSIMRMVKVIEGRLGRTLGPGFNPDVSSIRHTLDPVVPFSHRPLALYVAIASSRCVVRACLRLWGFRRSLAPCGTFFYWFRAAPASSDRSSSPSPSRPGPIVLFHGVGTGLPFYVLAIWKMCRERTSILVESPSIAMSLALLRGHKPPSESELVESVEGIMRKHGLEKAAFFGHSFGSISVAWMARRKPHLVSQIVLLDPVCLLLFLPNVARSFLHPDKTGMPLFERFMLYLVTQEKGISHTLRRHFWWYANVMWPEDIKCPIVVGLAGRDRIVPCKPLRRYLLSHTSFATKSSGPSGGNSAAAKGGGSRSGNVRAAGGVVVGGGGGGVGFSMLNGKTRCKVHTCNVASHGHAPSFGAALPSAGGGSIRVDGKGDRLTAAAAAAAAGWGSSAKDSVRSGDAAAAKKVELVYWAEAAHGNVLGDPEALDDFVRVAARQEQVFLAS